MAPWNTYGDVTAEVVSDEATEGGYSLHLTVDADVSPASITFHIAFAAADFWIDNVRFYEGQYIAP